MTSRWRSSGPRKTLVHDAKLILADVGNGCGSIALRWYLGGNDRGVLPGRSNRSGSR